MQNTNKTQASRLFLPLTISSVLIYTILTIMQVFLALDRINIDSSLLDGTAVLGIIVQIKMFISIHLVMKGNGRGYIISVVMNVFSLISSVSFLIIHWSSKPLPGVISDIVVLLIITFIKVSREKNTAYTKKINTFAVREQFYSNVFMQAPIGIAV